MKGVLITFEGSEGSGKSTQIVLIQKYLEKNKKKVLFVREPGGVKISEKIRRILLDVENKKMGDSCETLLYMAARAQLVEEIILPALKKGMIVLSDRFLDSTLAYQGYGNGVDIQLIKNIGKIATQGITPDLTFIFDLDVKEGFARLNRAKDRIEQRTMAYHNRVRQGYLAIASQEPKRVKVIKVNRTKEEIHEDVCQWVEKVLKMEFVWGDYGNTN
ncbi:Thymidylate kinase [hydrothermal vent metagenome]|uniref:dTMP kinase n=1 Tax=hydrothermal vent metagenome TaxID=652676 RepID=A0A3B1CY86_9ZZZZ